MCLAVLVVWKNNRRVAARDRDLGRRLMLDVVIYKSDRRVDDQCQPLLGNLNARQRNRARSEIEGVRAGVLLFHTPPRAMLNAMTDPLLTSP